MKKFIRFITAFFCVFMISVFASQHVHAEETETVTPSALSDEGQAYAVLTDAGEFIFFRSTGAYTNQSAGTFTDVKGNSYTGTVYAEFENMIGDWPQAPWISDVNKIQSVRVASDQVIAPDNMYGWFQSCENLITADLSGFDTSNVRDMSGLFNGCRKLLSVDLSRIDTSKVTGMGGMFSDCENLDSIDVSHFNTSNATSMSMMFDGCKSLKNLDVSGFDTSKVTDMQAMFRNCDSLTSLDITSFDTSNVSMMVNMFAECDNLKEIVLGDFGAADDAFTGTIFKNCISLESIDLSGFDTTGMKSLNGLFMGCKNLKKVDLSNCDTSSLENMAEMFFGCESLEEVNLSGLDTSKVNDMYGMFFYCKKLKKINLTGIDTSSVTNMSMMFDACESLEELDVSGFDTSSVIYMNNMFSGCESLKHLDVSGFDTSSVTGMGSMFSYCSSVDQLDVSGFDTSNVERIDWMFAQCKSVKELDVSGFDTSKVTSLSNMFYYCSAVEELDVSGFNTAKVTDMSDMFSGCTSLKAIDVSGFSTANVISMGNMFSDCESLKHLDVSGFNTAKVKSMDWMFYNCKNLEELDVSGFNTASCTSMDVMFGYCEKLKQLDVSHFNTSQVEDFNSMFAGLKCVKTLDLSNFDTSKSIYMPWMFSGMSELASVKIGPRFTVWCDDAYLPKGTWTNKAIGKSLTEKDLYSQYPSNAASYAGTWERTIVYPTSVNLDQTSLTISAGRRVTLKATVLPENAGDRSVKWTSSNPDVATVSDYGDVTAVSDGTAIITATTHNGLTAKCTVTVGGQVKPNPTSITISSYPQDLYVRVSAGLSADVQPANADQTVIWSVDKPNIATISQTGYFTGLKAGTVTVTAETVNGLKAKRTITVLFTDVPFSGKYYSNAVYWAVNNGITNGYTDSDGYARRFIPENFCTREAVVTFLWRLAGKPEPKSMNSPFSDVKDRNRYYYKAVLWAVEKGITKGYSDGTFRPNDTCLREHVVTFLYRYAGKPAPKTAKNPFNDVYKSDYYYNAAIWANENGIAKGYSDGPHAGGFGPKLDCLREHVVTFLYRYAQKF